MAGLNIRSVREAQAHIDVRTARLWQDHPGAQLWVHAQDLIRHSQSVIFEKGLWLRSERDEKRREARKLGVDIELHYFDVPIDELVRRLEKRNSAGNPNAFPISRPEIEEYFRIFEPPGEAELALFPGIDRPPRRVMTCGLAAMTGQRFVVPD